MKVRSILIQTFPMAVWFAPSALVVVALFAQHLFQPLVTGRPFIFLYPAISLGCFLGNRVSNIIAVFIAMLGAWWWFVPDIPSLPAYFGLGVFLISGVVISVFSDLVIKGIEDRARLAERELSVQKIEAQQKESAMQLADVLDTMSDSFFSVDREWRLTRVNAQYEKVGGVRREDRIGKSFRDILIERNLRNSKYWIEYHKVMNDRVEARFDDYYPKMKAWFECRAYPTSDGGMAVFFSDITDRRLLQDRIAESERTLDQIFSQSRSWMAFLTLPDYRYERANEAYFKLIGQRDIIGKTVLEVIPEVEGQGFIQILNNIVETGEPFIGSEVPITFAGENGGPSRLAYIDLVQMPLRRTDGSIYGIAAQGYDVTEKVLSRHALEKSKNAIQIERENFRNLFKQTPEMVCILRGPEHVFEFVNEAHIRALGFDATGKSVREAQPESVEVHGILDDVYRTGKTAELHEIPVTVGERKRYFNLTYAARTDDSGAINGVMILGAEVTEQVIVRERLLESQYRYQALFDFSPLPKWIMDVETFRFLNVNLAAIKLYGYSKEEFLSMRATEIRAEEDVPHFVEAMARDYTIDSQTHPHRFRHRKKDGTFIEVEVSALDLMLDGRKVRIAAIVDVTERVASEFRQVELLESLQSAKEEAERANELKSAFLANMSHEIRTPLGAMVGFADLLRDPGLSHEEHSNYINILIRNGEQLSAIINDILDLSKVEAGHLTLEFTVSNPNEIVADVVSLLRVKANEKDLILEFTAEDTTPNAIVTDPLRVRQIMMNVVGNAIKFTQAGSVKIRSFGAETHSGRTLYFEVTDTGIGIPESERERVFEAFVQADGTLARKFGGTGLGLALSRQLARNLGGDVVVTKTSIGRGTTFLIAIQDQPSRQHAMSPSQRKEEFSHGELGPDALDGANVLIVDDSPDNRQLIWRFLTKYGATVDFAENGLVGYRKALVGNFDVVLMDIQMPEMDGYIATQKLREAGYRKPIIALTAHAMSEVRKKCINVGCNDHLTKPIKSKELIGAVAKYVQL